MRKKWTLADLKNYDRDTITPQQVTDVLRISRKTFMETAKNTPEKLGFRIMQFGERIVIPKSQFIQYVENLPTDNRSR